MGGVYHHHVDAGFHQLRHAVERIGAGAHSSGDQQTATAVLGGAREFLRLLEVLHGNHAREAAGHVYHQHLLDAVLVEQAEHFALRGVLTHRHEPLLRRHHVHHLGIETVFEAEVAGGHNADHFTSAVHYRHTGDALGAGEFDDGTDRLVGRYRDGIRDDAGFVLLHAQHFTGLRIGGHVFVNDADATFLRQRDGEAGFSDGVHGGRDERDVQTDAAGELGRQVDVAWQYFRVRRHEQDVVEGKCFLDDAHDEPRASGDPAAGPPGKCPGELPSEGGGLRRLGALDER